MYIDAYLHPLILESYVMSNKNQLTLTKNLSLKNSTYPNTRRFAVIENPFQIVGRYR